MAPSRIAIALALLAGAAACGADRDDFSKAVHCLEEHHARESTPSAYKQLVARRGWRVARFVVGGDRVILIGAPTEAAAREARRRGAKVSATLGGPPPIELQRRGKVVGWWEEPPSDAHAALVDDCI